MSVWVNALRGNQVARFLIDYIKNWVEYVMSMCFLFLKTLLNMKSTLDLMKSIINLCYELSLIWKFKIWLSQLSCIFWSENEVLCSLQILITGV